MLEKWLKESNYTVVFTGAGMSTESGLPDFRSSNNGLWRKKDPSQIASTKALNENVEEFIEFYKERVLGVKQYGPHKGHYILAKWEQDGIIKSIITQNVDGFHTEAGSKQVAQLHGTLQKFRCLNCNKEIDSEIFIKQKQYCECGGVLRPNVVLFGEMLPQDAFQTAYSEAEKADLFIVLGSSLSVTPANQFPIIAKQNGAKLVIVNMEPTELDMYADEVIHGRKIGELLEELDKKISVEN